MTVSWWRVTRPSLSTWRGGKKLRLIRPVLDLKQDGGFPLECLRDHPLPWSVLSFCRVPNSCGLIYPQVALVALPAKGRSREACGSTNAGVCKSKFEVVPICSALCGHAQGLNFRHRRRFKAENTGAYRQAYSTRQWVCEREPRSLVFEALSIGLKCLQGPVDKFPSNPITDSLALGFFPSRETPACSVLQVQKCLSQWMSHLPQTGNCYSSVSTVFHLTWLRYRAVLLWPRCFLGAEGVALAWMCWLSGFGTVLWSTGSVAKRINEPIRDVVWYKLKINSFQQYHGIK